MGLITQKPGKYELSVKTKKEREIIETYFFPSKGCKKKIMTNSTYKQMVLNKKKKLDIKHLALEKLNISESIVNEIPPLEICGFSFSGNYMARDGYSSKYQTTWLFFSNNQIYVYSYIFDMISKTRNEFMGEYFYKDITNFTNSTDSVEYIIVEQGTGCFGPYTRKGIKDTSNFSIIVPGNKFSCSMQKNETIEKQIQNIKQKLREKKNS